MEEKITKIVAFMIPMLMIITILYFGISFINDRIHKSTEKIKQYKSTIGTSVILKSDTLMVIDYSELYETLTLDNNQEISIELYKKIKIGEIK